MEGTKTMCSFYNRVFKKVVSLEGSCYYRRKLFIWRKNVAMKEKFLW